MNKISQKHKDQFNQHFISFLRNNFLNTEIQKIPENSVFKQIKQAPSPIKEGESSQQPLVEALRQIPNSRTVHNFDIEDQIINKWRNSHIKGKKDFPDSKGRIKKKQARNQLLADIIKKTSRAKYDATRHFGQIGEFRLPMKFAYAMLVVILFSALISFQGPSIGVVSFFDKIFLSPFKILASNPKFVPLVTVSPEKKSEYIIHNSQYLQELRKNNINSIKIETDVLNGRVAGVSEIKSIENKNGFSIFLKKIESLIK